MNNKLALAIGICGAAKQAAKKLEGRAETDEKRTSVAKATGHFEGLVPGMNPRPTARTSCSAACKAQPAVFDGLKSALIQDDRASIAHAPCLSKLDIH